MQPNQGRVPCVRGRRSHPPCCGGLFESNPEGSIMRLITAWAALIVGITTFGALAESNEPDLAVPCVGTELAEWEDFARLSWVGHQSLKIVCRQTTRDGSTIDLEETFCDQGWARQRVWEVTRDWRRGVSKLAFLQSVRTHAKLGLLLVNDTPIDKAELLRCEAACRMFGIKFRTVDQWGAFR